MRGRKDKFWSVKAESNKRGSLYIYGTITAYKWDDADVTAKQFADDLEALGDVDALDVFINSPGGSVFQGQAIYSILKRFGEKTPVHVHVDGLAASIASVIAMAGSTVTMPRNAMMMVHNPWSIAIGNAADFRKEADTLDRIRVALIEAYMSKVNITEDKLSELLDAETWLTAQECHDYGFCDELGEEKQVAASVDPEIMAHYRNAPPELLVPASPAALSEAERQARIEAAEQAQRKIKSILEVL